MLEEVTPTAVRVLRAFLLRALGSVVCFPLIYDVFFVSATKQQQQQLTVCFPFANVSPSFSLVMSFVFVCLEQEESM